MTPQEVTDETTEHTKEENEDLGAIQGTPEGTANDREDEEEARYNDRDMFFWKLLQQSKAGQTTTHHGFVSRAIHFDKEIA